MTKIQLRHDTSTKWQTVNPILAPGEVAVETDTQKIKVGNGSTAYNSLQYIGTTRTTNETNLNNIIESGTYYFSGTRWSNLANKPFNNSNYTIGWLLVISYNGGNTAQIAFSGSGNTSDCDFAIRYRISSKWRSWHYVRPTNVLGYNIPLGLVQLDSSGKLPAVDGSQLTNLPNATAPTNMVTTDTQQTITGLKNFQGGIAFQNTSGGTSSFSIIGDNNSNLSIGDFGYSFYQIILDASNKISLKAPAVTIGDSGAQVTNGDNQAFINTGNFATLAPTGALKYWTGTEAEYTAINTKDPDTLYRTTDTNKVFLGTIQLGG